MFLISLLLDAGQLKYDKVTTTSMLYDYYNIYVNSSLVCPPTTCAPGTYNTNSSNNNLGQCVPCSAGTFNFTTLIIIKIKWFVVNLII